MKVKHRTYFDFRIDMFPNPIRHINFWCEHIYYGHYISYNPKIMCPNCVHTKVPCSVLLMIRYIFYIFGKMLENRRRKRRREKREDLKGSTPISVEYWQLAPDISSALLKNIFFPHFLEKRYNKQSPKRGFKLSLSPCSIICNWKFELNKEEHPFPCQIAI